MTLHYRICLALLVAGTCAFALPAPGAEGEKPADAKPAEAAPAGEDAGFKSDNPLHAPADIVLNEARANLGDAASARQRIVRLEDMLARFPDYKYRADAYYFVGLNAQLLGENDRAVRAFEDALRAEPGIADETPIASYLRAAKGRTFLRTANVALLALLAVVLLPALWRLTRADGATLPWGRLFAVYVGATAAWIALVYLLPGALGSPHAGMDAFPKPVLSDFRLGQIGDEPLRALLAYGLGAILATLPIVASTARIRRPGLRRMLTILGVLAVVGTLLGLYAIRHLYVNARYQADSNRLVFLVRSIDSIKEVPDEMLPLYDKDFVRKIQESRKPAGK